MVEISETAKSIKCIINRLQNTDPGGREMSKKYGLGVGHCCGSSHLPDLPYAFCLDALSPSVQRVCTALSQNIPTSRKQSPFSG